MVEIGTASLHKSATHSNAAIVDQSNVIEFLADV